MLKNEENPASIPMEASYPSETTAEALKKKPRITEMIIQGFLFTCGALSILVTIGIVFVLGKESLLFFTKHFIQVAAVI